MGRLDIRLARQTDLEAIREIYNYYIANSTCTYQVTPETAAERQAWFDHHDDKHPVMVAESDGEIVGWSSLSPFHPRPAYRGTVENSVYVRHGRERQGIGAAMLDDLIERARTLGYHTIIASIDAEQTASVALHARFGFEEVAHLREVGFKFGRLLDVVYMQLMLS